MQFSYKAISFGDRGRGWVCAIHDEYRRQLSEAPFPADEIDQLTGQTSFRPGVKKFVNQIRLIAGYIVIAGIEQDIVTVLCRYPGLRKAGNPAMQELRNQISLVDSAG